MLIEQGKLIKEDRTQGEQLTAVQALDGHVATPFEAIFEQAIEGFDGLGAQLVEDAPHFHPAVGMWIGPAAGCDQFPVLQGALGS